MMSYQDLINNRQRDSQELRELLAKYPGRTDCYGTEDESRFRHLQFALENSLSPDYFLYFLNSFEDILDTVGGNFLRAVEIHESLAKKLGIDFVSTRSLEGISEDFLEWRLN